MCQSNTFAYLKFLFQKLMIFSLFQVRDEYRTDYDPDILTTRFSCPLFSFDGTFWGKTCDLSSFSLTEISHEGEDMENLFRKSFTSRDILTLGVLKWVLWVKD